MLLSWGGLRSQILLEATEEDDTLLLVPRGAEDGQSEVERTHMPVRNEALHPKWLFDERVYCYLDGEKFQATSRDISAGGIFLRTRRDVPKESAVVLVFRDKAHDGHEPIFLVGCPVRYQQAPQKGVGIQWLKAVTSASVKTLTRFLKTRMQLQTATVFEEGCGPEGEKRSVHLFPLALLQSMSAPAAPAPGRGATTPFIPAGSDGPTMTGLDLKVIRQDGSEMTDAVETGEEAFAPVAAGPVPGPQEPGDSKDLLPTRLKARARIDGEVHEATVLSLGHSGMYLQVPRAPANLSSEVDVFFYLKARQGSIPVRCACRTIFEDAATDGGGSALEMEILRFEDSDMKTATAVYLKWLLTHPTR